MNPWFLAAYAGYASFAHKNKENDVRYLEGLQDLPSVAGLELPFYSDLSETNSDKFLRTLPKHWDYILTLLPGTMQSLGKTPGFGLASTSAEGRRAAMSRMALVHRRIHEINDRCGRAAVRAVELHSAPTRPFADAQSLYNSLEELDDWDWQGTQLLLEHCDSWREDGSSVKGFMTLKEELGILRELTVGLALNWGRSVLEERDVSAALNHIEMGREQLGAFFFSGTTLNDPVYGSWTDSHAPLKLGSKEPWEPQVGLLTEVRVRETYNALKGIPGLMMGIKVQPTPPELTIEQRLDFLAQQINAFDKACQT